MVRRENSGKFLGYSRLEGLSSMGHEISENERTFSLLRHHDLLYLSPTILHEVFHIPASIQQFLVEAILQFAHENKG